MHKFMRTVGFSMYQKKRDMEALLKELAAQAVRTGRMAEKDGSMFCELRAELADDMGVVLAGEMDEEGNFSQEYYFPYVKNTGISSAAECSIQRHACLLYTSPRPSPDGCRAGTAPGTLCSPPARCRVRRLRGVWKMSCAGSDAPRQIPCLRAVQCP